jgi:hypothetical protein
LADNVVNGIRISKVTVMNLDFLIFFLEKFFDFFRNGKLLFGTNSLITKRVPLSAKICFGRLFNVSLNVLGNDGLDATGIGPID